jgi:hypothetical protein
MSEKSLLWLLIAILVIIVVVKMCKNTNEDMGNNDSQLPLPFRETRYDDNHNILVPTNNIPHSYLPFRKTMYFDNEDRGYINNDYQISDNFTENNCYQPNDSNLPSGNYGETCGKCSFANDNLSCYCRTIDQLCKKTSLKLEKSCDNIQNCNGVLQCGNC